MFAAGHGDSGQNRTIYRSGTRCTGWTLHWWSRGRWREALQASAWTAKYALQLQSSIFSLTHLCYRFFVNINFADPYHLLDVKNRRWIIVLKQEYTNMMLACETLSKTIGLQYEGQFRRKPTKIPFSFIPRFVKVMAPCCSHSHFFPILFSEKGGELQWAKVIILQFYMKITVISLLVWREFLCKISIFPGFPTQPYRYVLCEAFVDALSGKS